MKYPISIRVLHFLLILIIFAQLAVGYGSDFLFQYINGKSLITLHKSLGLLGLIIVILLIIRRLFYKKPPYPNSMSAFEKLLARSVHFLLYLIVITMGASGMIASMLFHSQWLWFYLIPLPQLTQANPQLGANIFSIHIYGAVILSILVGLHILGALYHAIKKDGIMRRMF